MVSDDAAEAVCLWQLLIQEQMHTVRAGASTQCCPAVKLPEC